MNFTIFSGTFNPIHITHLIIAETVKTELNLDKIIFVPAFIPPHRDFNLADPLHRLNMVKLAVKNNKNFEISDIEFKNEDKSYSYCTVKKFYENNPDIKGKINFIIGSDAFSLIDSWYEAENFAKTVNFIIVQRPDNIDINEIFKNIKIKDFDYKIVNIPQMEISSSYIRNRIKENKSIKYLVPDEVAEYIYLHGLYKDE